MFIKSDKKKEKLNKQKSAKSQSIFTPEVKNYIPAYSNFYYFTEWMTNFEFYKTVHTFEHKDNEQCIMYDIILMKNGPNDFNVFKLIKAIDKLENKNFDDFNYLELMIINQDWGNLLQSSHPEETSETDPETAMRIRNINLHNEELVAKLTSLLEDLYKTFPKKFKKILDIGPPNNLRWILWSTMAKINYEKVDNKIDFENERLYYLLLNRKLKKKTQSKILEEIKNISFYPFKSKEPAQVLFSLLKAYSLYDITMGYQQRMEIIVSYLLIISDFNENKTFLFMRYFFSSYYGLKFREILLEENNSLNLFLFTMDELIFERFPKIFETMKNLRVKSESIFILWIQSFFTSQFPFVVCVRFWDCIFGNGLNFMYNILLGIIKFSENELLSSDDDIDFIKTFDYDFSDETFVVNFREKVVQFALGIRITQNLIEKIQSNYEDPNPNRVMLDISNDSSNNGEIMKIKSIMEEDNEWGGGKDTIKKQIDGLSFNSEHSPGQLNKFENNNQSDNDNQLSVTGIEKDRTLTEVSLNEDNLYNENSIE